MKARATSSRSGHDRWLVSYADLVTLLFAFFTTLYAANPSSLQAAADSAARDAAAGAVGQPAGAAADTGVAASGTDALVARLTMRLEDDVRLQRADIRRDGRGIVVSLPEQATFAVGSAEVTAEARPLIARIVGELTPGEYALRIEGHTDDVPIRTSRYPSNWELSTARAGAVVAYLINDLHYPADRLSAAGYGEFHPLVPNDTVVNRSRNRRIDIVVIDVHAVTEAATR